MNLLSAGRRNRIFFSFRACERDAATRAAITSFPVLPPAVLRLSVQQAVTDLLTSSAVSPHLVHSRFGRFVTFWLLLDGL